MKSLYYYFFYKIYKFWDLISIPKFWSDAKALLSIMILELFILQSCVLYYVAFVNKQSDFGEGIIETSGMVLLVLIPNYFVFYHQDRWKMIIREFDKWPKRKNMIGGIIVWAIILTIVTQFFVLLFLEDGRTLK